jgi:hypothetical protein
VKDGELIDLALPGKKIHVRARAVDHTVPCLAYVTLTSDARTAVLQLVRRYFFSEVRKRLLPSLAGKSGKELGELRRAGQPIEEEVDVPQLIYFGDTSIDGVTALEEELVKFPVVIVESSFLYTEHRGAGLDAKKHIAWPELEPLVKRCVPWHLYSAALLTRHLKGTQKSLSSSFTLACATPPRSCDSFSRTCPSPMSYHGSEPQVTHKVHFPCLDRGCTLRNVLLHSWLHGTLSCAACAFALKVELRSQLTLPLCVWRLIGEVSIRIEYFLRGLS